MVYANMAAVQNKTFIAMAMNVLFCTAAMLA